MKSIVKSRLFNFAVFFALALVLLYYAFRSVNFTHIAQGFRDVNFFWIALSLLLALVAHALRAIRWGFLMQPLGEKPPFSNLFAAVMFGYLANLALPRFGEVAKCGSVSKSSRIRFDSLVGTVVVERAADVAMLLISTVIVVLIQIDTFGEYIYTKIVQPIEQKAIHVEGYKIVILLVMAIAFLLLIRFIFKSDFLGEKLNGKIKKSIQGVIDGLKSVYRTPKVWGFVLLSVLIWACYWLMTWALLWSTPITSHLTAWDALFIMVIGSYGMTVPVQGGFGAYHIVTASALGIFGITYENGLIFAVISHESQTLLLIIVGLLSLAYLYFTQHRQSA
ncbi:MAG: lysylphosphatidylglycerol synthase transmembrane domain-containing protein [Bacteroidota bacterium]